MADRYKPIRSKTNTTDDGASKRLVQQSDGTFAEVVGVVPGDLSSTLDSLPPKIVKANGQLSCFEVGYGGKTYRQTITYPDANTMTIGAWAEVV